MTIDEAKLPLFTFFSKSEVFNLEEDFKKIIEITFSEKLDKEILKEALKSFEEQKIVTRINIEKKDFWVLNKSLEQYSQTVELHYTTLAAITNIVNVFCEMNNTPEHKVNPLAITEKDIQNLTILANQGLKPKEDE